VGSSEKIGSYTGDKEFFIGNKTLRNPDGLGKISLDNNTGLGKTSCIGIQIEVDIEAYGNKEISIVLGAENNMLDVKNMAYKYSSMTNCREELSKVKKFWYEMLTKVQVNTPLESMNIMLNRMGGVSDNSIQTVCKKRISSVPEEQLDLETSFRTQ